MYKESLIKLMSDFLSEILKPQDNGIIYSNVERKRLQNKNFIIQQNKHSKSKGEIKAFQINKN